MYVKLPEVSISFIGPDLEEFLYVYIKGAEARYSVSDQYLSYGLTVKWLQIDNQVFDWEHPMLLFPTVLSKDQKEMSEHPFLSVGIIQSKDTSYGVTYYKYFGLLLQEFSIELGEELLRKIMAFASFSHSAPSRKMLILESDFVIPAFKVESDTSDVLFFEFFQLHPIKVNITFSRTEGEEVQGEKKVASRSYSPVSTIVDVLTMTVGNISVISYSK